MILKESKLRQSFIKYSKEFMKNN